MIYYPFCCIYVWLDPGTYMIARFIFFYKSGVTKDFRKGWEGAPTATCTTAMKTAECGGLQKTDRAVTTYQLPQQFRGVEYNLR